MPLVPALSCTGGPELWKLYPVQENDPPLCSRRLRCTVTHAGAQEEASSAAPLASDTIAVGCKLN